jgi:hypothetical protein
MKWTSSLGAAAVLVLAGAAALAQDFTAGKTPAQLFGSDCSECHRSPAGLAKNRDARTLAGFLRQHYTTKADNASSLAAYVSAFSGAAPPAASPARRAAASPRRDADADVARADPRTREEPPLRRRPPVNLSGEGEKRPPQEDAGPQRLPGPPRPPGDIRVSSAPASNGVRETAFARPQRGVPRGRPPVEEAAGRLGGLQGPGGLPDHARSGAGDGAATPREAADPLPRLKAYVTSGQDFETAAADATKNGSGNGPRRRENALGVAPEVPLGTAAEGGTEVPAAAGRPSVMPAPAALSAIPPAALVDQTAGAPAIPPAALVDPTAGAPAVREPVSSATAVPDAPTAPPTGATSSDAGPAPPATATPARK